MNRVALLLSFAFALLLAASSARASDAFPETMKSQLNLPDPPPLCTVCHTTLIGGLGTVTKPFGATLRMKYGVTLLNVQGLRNALMQMQANGDDSDGDGIGDIAEILQGKDPNVPEGSTAIDDAPKYGCQCSTVRGRSGYSAGLAVWIAGVAVSGWRFRRRPRRSSHALSPELSLDRAPQHVVRKT